MTPINNHNAAPPYTSPTQKHDGVVTADATQIPVTEKSSLGKIVIEFMRLLLTKKKFVIFTTSIITIATVIISLILPETFKSTCVILPEIDKSKLASLGGLSELASMAGVSASDAGSIKLFPAILKSESVLKPVLYNKYETKKFKDSVNFIEYLEIHAKTPELEYETALNSLREELEISMDIKTNIITLTLETKEPQLTADVLNSITSELDKFMRTKRTSNATKQRLWIETRLVGVKQELMDSENKLRDFREKNRVLSTSPLLLLEQERLLREVQINGTLFMELKKQYELIKIEEIKNIPIVNIMDPAAPAARKSKPKRFVMVLASMFISLIGSSSYIYVNHRYGTIIRTIKKQILRTDTV